MKSPIAKLCLILGAAVVLTSGAPSISAEPPKKKRTYWVAPPTGSLLGGGYYEQANSDEPPKNAAEALRNDVTTLNLRGQTSQGQAFVLPAVANQIGVSVKTLRAQQASTRMLYGDLLVANAIAKATGKSVGDVIRVRAKKKDWAEAAGELRVTVSSLASVARKTEQTADLARTGGARSRNQTGDQKLEDLGVRKNPTAPGG